MKVSSKIYKGIEYVQLSELPQEQKEKFTESVTEEILIKILIDKTIISNCVQYKDYERWFDTVYKKPVILTARKEIVAESGSIAIALGKA